MIAVGWNVIVIKVCLSMPYECEGNALRGWVYLLLLLYTKRGVVMPALFF